MLQELLWQTAFFEQAAVWQELCRQRLELRPWPSYDQNPMGKGCTSKTAQRQKSAGRKPDIRQCTSSISEHSRCSRWRDAISLWCKLPEKGLEPNTFTFNAAMAACGQGSLWPGSLRLFADARLRGVEIDTVSLNSCLSARKGQALSTWKSALSFLMPCQRAALRLDAFTCTAFFSVAKGSWWRARSFLESQLQEAIPTAGNLQLRNAYLSSALKDDWDVALWLLQEPMPQDAVTFKAISSPFSRSIAWWACMALLEDLRIQGLQSMGTTGTTPTFLVSSFARGELWQRALGSLRCHRSPAAITATTSACERAGLWEFAVASTNCMLNQGRMRSERILYRNKYLSNCDYLYMEGWRKVMTSKSEIL